MTYLHLNGDLPAPERLATCTSTVTTLHLNGGTTLHLNGEHPFRCRCSSYRCSSYKRVLEPLEVFAGSYTAGLHLVAPASPRSLPKAVIVFKPKEKPEHVQ